ncbi:MAG: GNAT family N-acetyltransferase [Muribaculaceae bacterium]|nr:GNAT family N-acetyltransferase [Muribaculaceae bacterium]
MKAFGKIFRESFKVDNAWADWFLGHVCRREDALTMDVDGHTASVALLTPYRMEFHGADVPVCYINSVATERKFRGQGLGSRLMLKALHTAAERGDDFAILIPATRRLYFFYDSFGFATVFYIDEQRYTSLHAFENPEGYHDVEPSWDMFSTLERQRSGAVVHSQDDYENILTDLALSDGKALAVENSDGSMAMIFFETTDSEIHVLDILSTDLTAREAALNRMRAAAGEMAVIVKAMPEGRAAQLRSRGMVRILNVGSVLSRIAETHPDTEQVIRVTDPIISINSGIYILKGGHCEKVQDTHRRITLDVSVDVLCRIIFSDKRIGDVFGLPAGRPFISLMLD